MWPEYYYPAGKKGFFSFSPRERREIGISVLVLTLAFSFVFSGGFSIFHHPQFFLFFALPIAFLAVITGFFLHEMGHRIVARHYGCWAEYRMWSFGLLLALFSSLFGAVFAAPGAVYISGLLDREKNGKISAAGPMTNVLTALLMFPIISVGGSAGEVAYFIAWINIFLAGFNLIPFPPLDGYKVFHWGILQYISMIAIIIATWMALTYMRSFIL